MTTQLVNVTTKHDQRGMTTAEYAVGTVASVSIVGILLAIIQNPEFQKLLWAMVKLIFDLVMKVMGG